MTIDRKTIETVHQTLDDRFRFALEFYPEGGDAEHVIQAYRTDQRRRGVVEVPVDKIRNIGLELVKASESMDYHLGVVPDSLTDAVASCNAILREWEDSNV